MKNDLDEIDISLHVLGAIVSMLIAHALDRFAGGILVVVWGMAIANCIFWPFREFLQGIKKRPYEPHRWVPWKWSLQKKWEAWPPCIVAVSYALILTIARAV